jgi:hypothetical protein
VADIHEVIQGTQSQTTAEQISYSLDVSLWGSAPAPVSVTVLDASDSFADVTTTVMPSGSASVTGNVISLPKLRALTAGHLYKILVLFDIGGNREEGFIQVLCEA